MSFDFDAYVAARTRQVNEALDRFTPAATEPPSTLHEAMRYSLLGGGKRIRPLLCLAAAEAVGADDPADVLPTACALEMVHTFSLVHDDLPALDNDDFRRGQPTLHRKYGEAMAILAGDALHTLAFATIATHQRASRAESLLRTLRLFAGALGTFGMVGGQVDDLYYERRDDVTPEVLRHIHARKTGALLNVSLLSGAILADATEAQEEALRTYGEQIGLAFQIVDDILDVVGDDAKLGKPTGSDAKHDKATYPKLFGLDESRRRADRAVQSSLSALDTFDQRAEPLRCFARFVVNREA
ncbi:MAG TPA: farnesyl diphosphate synthase [Armatimonadaceae bacterium]|nr:farnesyl diphosphate synthase [Armatimonadaceae bacterium]